MIGELTPLQKERREKILSAAAHYFSRVPFHKADMEQIAQQAGVGKGTLYRYFKNKSDLYARTIEYTLEQAFQFIQAEAQKADSLVKYLENIITAAVTYFHDNPVAFNIVLLSNTNRVETITQLVLQIQEKYFKNFSQKFREGVEKGLFKNLEPRIAIRVLNASILHLTYDLHAMQGYNRDEIIRHIKEIYLNGVLRTR
ncbi:MAG: TetR/AcrR family transcriptional regulator [Calditrichia bacterium]